MYTDFFKRKPSRAAVWRTLPPLSMEEMDLNQRADAITEKVCYYMQGVRTRYSAWYFADCNRLY